MGYCSSMWVGLRAVLMFGFFAGWCRWLHIRLEWDAVHNIYNAFHPDLQFCSWYSICYLDAAVYQ